MLWESSINRIFSHLSQIFKCYRIIDSPGLYLFIKKVRSSLCYLCKCKWKFSLVGGLKKQNFVPDFTIEVWHIKDWTDMNLPQAKYLIKKIITSITYFDKIKSHVYIFWKIYSNCSLGIIINWTLFKSTSAHTEPAFPHVLVNIRRFSWNRKCMEIHQRNLTEKAPKFYCIVIFLWFFQIFVWLC